MAFISDSALDACVNYVKTNGTQLNICSSEPVTYGEATTGGTYSLGYKASITLTEPADRTPTGRKVTVPALTGGTVTNSGTASYWALTDASSILVATGAITTPISVSAGNTFSLTSFDIGVPDAA